MNPEQTSQNHAENTAPLGVHRLWDGDTGTLPRDTRRALVRLIQGPYISAEHHPDLWNAVVSDEQTIHSHLADLFLHLVLDKETGVAFVRNTTDPTGAAPSVVRTMPLTFLDSVLLLHLRSLVLASHTTGAHVFVDREEIRDHLRIYRPATSTDESGFDRRVDACITKLEKASLLRKTDIAGRYEVSPVLSLVVGAEEVATISATYERLLAEALGEEPDLTSEDMTEDRDAVEQPEEDA